MMPMQLKTNSKKLSQSFIKLPSSIAFMQKAICSCTAKRPINPVLSPHIKQTADILISPKLATAQTIANSGQHMNAAVN
jgi:hypothetical protein